MAEELAIELAEGLAVEWNLGTLRDLEPGEPAPWRLRGALDWERFESLRVLSARTGDDVLVLAAARPAGAAGSDSDLVGAARVPADSESEAAPAADVLVSLELGGDGSLRRIGIELWETEQAPVRVAADRDGDPRTEELEAGGHRVTTRLAVRIDGRSGPGVHDLLTRGSVGTR